MQLDLIAIFELLLILAEKLEGKSAVPGMKEKLPLIKEVQTDTYWEAVAPAVAANPFAIASRAPAKW